MALPQEDPFDFLENRPPEEWARMVDDERNDGKDYWRGYREGEWAGLGYYVYGTDAQGSLTRRWIANNLHNVLPEPTGRNTKQETEFQNFMRDMKARTLTDLDNVRWKFRRLLGKGGFATASLWQQQGNRNSQYPLDIVVKESKISGGDDQFRLDSLLHERDILNRLKNCPSKHVLLFYGDAFHMEDERVRLYLEYCRWGSMYQLLEKRIRRKEKFHEKTLWGIFYQLLRGASVLEFGNENAEANKNADGNESQESDSSWAVICHFDSKPENVLLGSKDITNPALPCFKETIRMKEPECYWPHAEMTADTDILALQDGWKESGKVRLRRQGTQGYYTPEQFSHRWDTNDWADTGVAGLYGSKSNIWGLGMLMWQLTLLKSDPFFPSTMYKSNRPSLQRGNTFGWELENANEYSDIWKDIVLECLHERPRDRPEISDLLRRVEEGWRVANELQPENETWESFAFNDEPDDYEASSLAYIPETNDDDYGDDPGNDTGGSSGGGSPPDPGPGGVPPPPLVGSSPLPQLVPKQVREAVFYDGTNFIIDGEPVGVMGLSAIEFWDAMRDVRETYGLGRVQELIDEVTQYGEGELPPPTRAIDMTDIEALRPRTKAQAAAAATATETPNVNAPQQGAQPPQGQQNPLQVGIDRPSPPRPGAQKFFCNDCDTEFDTAEVLRTHSCTGTEDVDLQTAIAQSLAPAPLVPSIRVISPNRRVSRGVNRQSFGPTAQQIRQPLDYAAAIFNRPRSAPSGSPNALARFDRLRQARAIMQGLAPPNTQPLRPQNQPPALQPPAPPAPARPPPRRPRRRDPAAAPQRPVRRNPVRAARPDPGVYTVNQRQRRQGNGSGQIDQTRRRRGGRRQ